MVRLMLVLAPVMCILSGIGISAVLFTYMKNLESGKEKKSKKSDDNYPKKSEVSSVRPSTWAGLIAKRFA